MIDEGKLKDMVLGFFLTQDCNFSCKHCLNQCPIDEKLPYEKFTEIIDIFSVYDLKKISFTGGEPILHPDFKKIVAYAVKNKLEFIVHSNAYLYKEYAFLLQYVPEYFKTIVFSLEGLEKNHDQNRRKGSYKKVLEAIDFFKSKDVAVKINLAITSKNYLEVEELLSILAGKKVDAVHLGAVIENDVNQNLILGIDKRKIFANKCDTYTEKYNMPVLSSSPLYNYGGSYFCGKLDNMNAVFINQRGEFIFCCNIKDPFGKIGLIKKDNLPELFAKKQALSKEIRKDRLEKFINLELNEIDEHSCEYCNKYFYKKSIAKY